MKNRSKEMLKNPMCISSFSGRDSSSNKKDDSKTTNKKQHTDIIELFELKRHVNFFNRRNLVSMMSNCDDKELLIKGINDILNDNSIDYSLRYHIMDVCSSSFSTHKYWKEMRDLLDYSFMGNYVIEGDDRCLLNDGYYFKGRLIQAFINDIRRIDFVVFPDGNVSKVIYKMSDGKSVDLYVKIDHFGSLVEVDITKVKIKEIIMRDV